MLYSQPGGSLGRDHPGHHLLLGLLQGPHLIPQVALSNLQFILSFLLVLICVQLAAISPAKVRVVGYWLHVTVSIGANCCLEVLKPGPEVPGVLRFDAQKNWQIVNFEIVMEIPLYSQTWVLETDPSSVFELPKLIPIIYCSASELIELISGSP